MSLQKNELIKLAKVAANAKANSQVAYSFGKENFSCEDINATLRSELKELAGDYASYRENKNTLFTLIEEVITDYLPKKVIEQYGQFADVKVFGQGDKPVFRQKVTNASRKRAKQFITKVGLAGVYEVFKLDGQSFEVKTTAFGGAAQIGIEEFLDGRVDFADLLEVIMEGLDEVIYLEIEKALIGAADSLATANKTTQNSFVEVEMDKLLAIADSYGQSSIYCTFEFAATMLPSGDWISESHREQKWDNGYIARYKNHNVVVLAQSYTDETNTTKVIDPSYAWIIPAGSSEKPVKIAFEGDTIVTENANADLSRDVQVYKKVGVAALITNNICVYKNTSLTK